jgi:hypothetical protein
MNRARVTFAATLTALAFGAGPLPAQQAPPMKQVLAGKKLTPPIRGEALVEYTAPQTKRSGKMVVTTITVKNAALAPIPRLTISETWRDKENNIIGGGRAVVEGLMQPGEIKTITIETPYDARMNSNGWNFSHANGTCKITRVPKLEVPKEQAAGAAPAPPAAKK